MQFQSLTCLAAAFRQRPDAVRADIEELCGEDLKRLVREYKRTFALKGEERTLIKRSLRWMASYAGSLKAETLAEFDRRASAWKEFEYFLLLAWSRLVLWNPQWSDSNHFRVAAGPVWVEDKTNAASGDLPPSGYNIDVFCHPAEGVPGDLVDWLHDEGVTWLAFADAMGHGLPAFLIAQAFRCIWKRYATGRSVDPADVLGQSHAVLIELWPPGHFLQTTLARFDEFGCVTLVSAGGSFLYSLPAGEDDVAYEALAGDMLGIDFGRDLEYDRQVRDLRSGEEVMLATDGLPDHFELNPPAFLLRVNERPADEARRTLYRRTEVLITEALQEAKPEDDITFVSMRWKGKRPPVRDADREPAAGPIETEVEWPRDDASLVGRYLAGDKTAERELFERFQRVVSRTVVRILGKGRSADWPDACQGAFVRLFANVATWQGRCPLDAWVAVVAARVAIDAMNSNDTPPVSIEMLADIEDRSPASDVAVVECIEKKIAAFRPDWQRAIQLRKEGCTTEEIAAKLGKSVRSVQVWFRKMYEQLAPCLDR